MKNILILCTGNSCRSQMVHGYLKHLTNNKNVHIYSAGTETHGVNLQAIATMKEDGIDISTHTSNHVNEYLHLPFDYVLTVCDKAKESCPFFPSGAIKIHYNFPDPAKATGTPAEIQAQFKTVRELIKTFCENFVTEQALV